MQAASNPCPFKKKKNKKTGKGGWREIRWREDFTLERSWRDRETEIKEVEERKPTTDRGESRWVGIKEKHKGDDKEKQTGRWDENRAR